MPHAEFPAGRAPPFVLRLALALWCAWSCLAGSGCDDGAGPADAAKDAAEDVVGDSAVVDASDMAVAQDAARDAAPDVRDGATPDAQAPDAQTPDAGPVGQQITACETATVPQADPANGPWRVEGWPLLPVGAQGTTTVTAPAVARPIAVELVAGEVRIPLVFVPGELPPGLAVGLAPGCAPFEYGVASGDPAPTSVMIWTRVETVEPLRWVVARDAALTVPVANGEVVPNALNDHTVSVEVPGLEPATTYYYRFDLGDRRSPIGRTRTAGARDHVRAAVMSCSSLYSGYFNAYRRVAERTDLDLVIHVGDYLYDFVDEDERVRLPDPLPDDPESLAAWRRRHAFYLTDPDLRAARAAHPWFVIWDNHDLNKGRPEQGGGVQAFREWVPMRQPDPARPEVAYRALDYGPLLRVIMMDDYLFSGTEMLPEGGVSVLGNAQYDWISEQIGGPETWRIIATQKQTTDLFTGGVGAFDVGWSDFPEARRRLFARLQALGQRDNVVVTGHNHWTFLSDWVAEPTAEPVYDAETGVGSYGAEFMAASISRGNFDEFLGGGPSPEFYEILRERLLALNPHHAHDELTSHGYGLVDVRPERLQLEMWYSPILAPTDSESFGGGWVLPVGRGHLLRERVETPSTP